MKKFLALLCLSAIVFTFIFAYTMQEKRMLQEIDGSSSLYVWKGTGKKCYIPDCNRTATYQYNHVVDSTANRHANLSIANAAHCETEVRTRVREKLETYQTKENYIKVVPDGWGNYYAFLEEDVSEFKLTKDTYEVYCLDVVGYYCDEHNAEAVESIKSELKNAVCDNFLYFYGSTLYPYNAIVLIVLFIYLFWKSFENTQFVQSFKKEGEAISAIRHEKDLKELNDKLSYSSGGSMGFAIFFLLPAVICLIKAENENWKTIWIVACCLAALIEVKYIIEVILLKRKIRVIEEQCKINKG